MMERSEESENRKDKLLFGEVLRLAISWLLILGWVSFYRGFEVGNGSVDREG